MSVVLVIYDEKEHVPYFTAICGVCVYVFVRVCASAIIVNIIS